MGSGPGPMALYGINSATYPADAKTYYFGASNHPWKKLPNQNKIYIPRNGIITKIALSFTSNVVPTQETFDIILRVNDTTDYTVFRATRLQWGSRYTFIKETKLNIQVNSENTIEFKVTTPKWETNPTSVRTICMLILSY